MTSTQVLLALVAILAVQAVTGIAIIGLGRRASVLARALPFLVSGSAGVLLATACMDLLPDAVHASGTGHSIWAVFLLSFLLLFCFQAAAHWLTDRAASEETAKLGIDGTKRVSALSTDHVHVHAHTRGSPGALLLGSGLHSFVDGIAIIAAFSASSRAGWSAALAVGLHELPHRMSDFALLLHLGKSHRQALQLSIVAGAAALIGGLSIAAFGQHQSSEPMLLAVSAATFLYISLVDLIPELHAHRGNGKLPWQVLSLVCGAGAMAVIISFL